MPPLNLAMGTHDTDGTTISMDERETTGAADAPATESYWRSLEQLEQPEAHVTTPREFAPGQFSDGEDGLPKLDRRRFMQLMGASTALAGAASCRWKETSIVPFADRPDGRVPGVPEFYATQLEVAGYAQPLVVTSFDGRPIKVEGNAEHPESAGAATTIAQATLLDVYDPDRAPVLGRGALVRRAGGAAEYVAGWAAFDEALNARLEQAAAKRGAGLVVVLGEATSSPTVARLKQRFASRFPDALWLEDEPLSRDAELAGHELVFGERLVAHYRLADARVVVSLDSDLFSTHPSAVRHSREFARRRRPENGPMNRMYAVEANHTATGSSADHRLPLRAEQVAPFVAALEAKVLEIGRLQAPAGHDAAAVPSGGFLAEERVARFVAALAADLVAQRGDTVLLAGPGQPAAVHAVVARLNVLLGNVGRTVDYLRRPGTDRPLHAEARQRLADALRAGDVETLIVVGGNPVATAPRSLGLADVIGRAQFSVHFGLYDDETSERCTWHAPLAHPFESWSDSVAPDGSVCIGQPLLLPLHHGRSLVEIAALLAGEDATDAMALVRATFAAVAGADGDRAWRRAVHDGFVGTPAQPVTVRLAAFAMPAFEARALAATVENGQFELAIVPDPKILDGRAANNAWLQELPEFVTKLTWDNAALMAPSTAKELGVGYEDTIDLEIDGVTLAGVPVYPLPGHARGAVTLWMGWGRTRAGQVAGFPRRPDDDGRGAPEPTGFDAHVLAANGRAFRGGLRVRPTGGHYPLACTQEHFQMDATGQEAIQERAEKHLIRTGTVAEYQANPDFADYVLPGREHEGTVVPTPYPPLKSLWREFTYTDGHRWGMSIDLSMCTGCNACVVACQSENNIATVGKEQVRRGREMHWLRIDRYFVGDDMDTPRIATQPVACVHCELAPCESVCPVAATVHSDEGLNDMVYNRCIGTRYCSNNCPYKVRRFNFFNYHKEMKKEVNEVQKLVHNPEVTVRMRGVMEKCTYCVQRIQAAKIAAGNERRRVREGEVRTACQQTCPAEAIRFGDLNDPTSRVKAEHDSPRAYDLLSYLNTKPRTAYLARVRNPNAALEA